MISGERIEEEKSIISNHFKIFGLFTEYSKFTWDGRNLYGESDNSLKFITNRNDLMDDLTELCQIPLHHLKPFS